jgi:phosphate transport system substrate-binding protein
VKELKGKPPLQLTGEVLADIYLGKVKKWNDDKIKDANPGVDLPEKEIVVVHRKGPSGTTQLFVEYLAEVCPRWREKVGPPKSDVAWPVGEGEPRNLDLARKVSKTEGAIGYVDRMFTKFAEWDLDYAAMQNKDKTAFVRAEPDNLTAAVSGILGKIPEDLGFNGVNQPGKDAYPITGVIYAMCAKPSAEERQRVVNFLRWATHEGEAFAPKMTLAPVPAELVKAIDSKLDALASAP